MTLDELIDKLVAAREKIGGDSLVMASGYHDVGIVQVIGIELDSVERTGLEIDGDISRVFKISKHGIPAVLIVRHKNESFDN